MDILHDWFESKQCMVFSSKKKDQKTHDVLSTQMKEFAYGDSAFDVLYIDGSKVTEHTSIMYVLINELIDKYQVSDEKIASLFDNEVNADDVSTLQDWEQKYSYMLTHGKPGLSAYSTTVAMLIEDVMNFLSKQRIHLLLDNIGSLKFSDKMLCNSVLYSRGATGIAGNLWMHLKINNTLGDWKCFRYLYHRVESVHDYSDRCVDKFCSTLL